MKPSAFIASTEALQMPEGLDVYQQAIWHAGTGHWEKAHQLIQDLPDKKAAHIHAYLHREEGDQWNAEYWYAKAGQPVPNTSLREEWEALVKTYC